MSKPISKSLLKQEFNLKYSYIYFEWSNEAIDNEVDRLLELDYSLERKMDLLSDFILSQDLADDVVE